MRLTAISVFNVGVFSGRHVFTLNSNGLTCFLGKNGSGKTTLFQCIQLGLFGKSSPFFKYSSYKGIIAYKDYLKSLVNKTTHKSASVEIFFEETQNGKKNLFLAKRTWNTDGVEHFDFYKNDEKVLINNDFQMQFATMMNPNAANLYFFDGEQVDYWSDIKNIRNFLQTALSSFLGIDILEKSTSALRLVLGRLAADNLIKKEQQQEQHSIDRAAFLQAQVAKAEAEKKVHRSKVYLEGCETSLKQSGFISKEIKEAYYKRLNDLTQHSSNLSKVIARSKSAELKLRSNIEVLFNLIEERDQRIIQDLDTSIFPVVEALFKRYALNKSEVLKAFEIEDAKELASELKNTKAEMEGIKKSLNEISCDTKVKELLYNYKEAQKQLTKDELFLAETERVLKEERNKLSLAEKEFNLRQETLKDELKKNFHVKAHILNIDKSLFALDSFKTQLIQSRLSVLNKVILKLFNILYHKPDFISNLKIEHTSESLDVLLFDKNIQLNLTQLSAGERQLFALAMIGAIGEVSNFSIPFVIDTPLSRLDVQHRKNFVKTFLRKDRRQAIVFATDDEANYMPDTGDTTVIDLTNFSSRSKAQIATAARP